MQNCQEYALELHVEVKRLKKEVGMGRAGLLPGVSCTRVKAHARKQDLAYAGPFPHTQKLKNTPAYARTELRTHKFKLHT